MLTMMTSGQSRDPLFPGGPCALSPTSNNMPRHERLSQLDMIFDVIGTPSRATIDAMTGGHADNRLIRDFKFEFILLLDLFYTCIQYSIFNLV